MEDLSSPELIGGGDSILLSNGSLCPDGNGDNLDGVLERAWEDP